MEKELTPREKVGKWLDSIGETDEGCRAEVMQSCADRKEARDWYLSKYDEMMRKDEK